jgi:hypothetical protein
MTYGLRAVLFAIRRRPFIEDGAQSLAIESETESVFLCNCAIFVFRSFWSTGHSVPSPSRKSCSASIGHASGVRSLSQAFPSFHYLVIAGKV